MAATAVVADTTTEVDDAPLSKVRPSSQPYSE
jgi:hypothetical protein